MTLAEYRKKVENIKKTHPAPSDAGFIYANRHYRKIIDSWQKELNKKDRETVESEDRQFAKKMAS